MTADTAFQERKTTPGSSRYAKWETARNSIYPLLVSPEHTLYQKGKGYLEYSSFLDLLVFYCVRMEHPAAGVSRMVTVESRALGEWGISRREMQDAAMANLEKDGYWISSVQSLLQSFMGEDAFPEPLSLYVLTNHTQVYGAAGFLMKEMISGFAEEKGRSLYIIPSSIHELLLYPDFGDVSPEELSGYVKEVNRTQVQPQDRLSDHVYYYDRQTDAIRIP